MPNDVPERVRFGPYEADLHTLELWKHGLRIKLVGQPFEILTVLLARPGELVTREELHTRLWPGDTFVDFDHGLNAAVNKLRDALSDSADEPRYIETLPRRGYRFVAKVERVARVAPASVPQTPAAASPATGSRRAGSSANISSIAKPNPASVPAATSAPMQPFAPGIPPRPWWKIPAIAAVLILLVLGFVFAGILHRRMAERSASFLAGDKSASAPLIELTSLPDPTSEPAFSPDGTRVAFRRQGYAPGASGIYVKTIGSLQLQQLTNNPGDCCPVWSPDGRQIAFSRFNGQDREIRTMASSGGDSRILCSTHLGPRRGEIDWSPDGQLIAFTGEPQAGSSSIFVVSLKNDGFRSITMPPLANKDSRPAFSPDGRNLAFIRTRETGLPEMVMVMPAAGGETRVVITENNGIVGPLAWSADSQSILFSMGEPSLLRVPVGGGEVAGMPEVRGPAWYPAVSRKGYRLAYQKISRAVSIFQMDLDSADTSPHPGPRTLPARGVVVTDTGKNEGAQVSPDGKKLAFMSNRSGSMEIWMSDRDGTNAIQLTALDGAGTPRWSPDSRSIAFDRDDSVNGGIFIVSIERGRPRSLVQNRAQNLVPSWSQDGRWVYYASNNSGAWQVWKVPAEGGTAVQVTVHGGFAAYESRTGKQIYYSKFNMPNPEVWKMPAEGGAETRVSSLLRPETWANWTLTDRGIYFVATEASGDPSLMFLDFATGDAKHISTLDKLPFWLSASPDGKSLLFEHLDQENSHVMLLENFR